jgi:hypothetical protein
MLPNHVPYDIGLTAIFIREESDRTKKKKKSKYLR